MQTYYASVGLCRHPILSADVLWATPSAIWSIKMEESKFAAVLSLNDFKIFRKGGSIARRTWKDTPNKKYQR